jgi:hypothetical protein
MLIKKTHEMIVEEIQIIATGEFVSKDHIRKFEDSNRIAFY